MARNMSNGTGKTTTAPAPRKAAERPVQQMASQAAPQQAKGSPMTAKQAETARKMANLPHEAIAQRAYEIWRSQGGSEMENWLKAERELRTDDRSSVQ